MFSEPKGQTMNRSTTLVLATAAFGAAALLQATLSDAATDAIKILSAVPHSGTHLARGAPLNIDVVVEYGIVSPKTAWLDISIGEMSRTPPKCAATDAVLSDANGMQVDGGVHQAHMQLTWSGDTGANTKGLVFGTGFVAFYPSFWTTQFGTKVKQFGMAPGYCYPFG